MPDTRQMFAQLKIRPLCWLVLLAWVAQASLPVAHALQMAQHEAERGFCGRISTELARQLAALPSDIREILTQGMALSGASDDCVQACATASPASATAPEVASYGMLQPDFENSPLASTTASRGFPHPVPPARGPPKQS